MKEIERIEELLIETTPPNMIVELEALRQPLLSARVDKYVELTKAKEQMRHPKDKDLTDWDRKTMNDAMVAELQSEYDYLVGLEELVKERINFTWQ